jgi:hypothetical protein
VDQISAAIAPARSKCVSSSSQKTLRSGVIVKAAELLSVNRI